MAVKVLGGVRTGQDAWLEREMRALATLRHPHIVRLYEQGTVSEAEARAAQGQLVSGQPWFAMERADGGLAGRVGRWSWLDIRSVLAQVLPALAHAHARGVLHLDLKPENLLVQGDDTILLADFGVALDRSELSTWSGDQLRGNLAAMAPEQLQGAWRELGPWTDLFGLGRMIWQWLSGEAMLPDGLSPAEAWAFAQYPTQPPPLPPDAPPGLAEVIGLLLAADPRARIRRAADLRFALEELEAGRSLPWPPSPPVPATWRQRDDEERRARLARDLPGLGFSLAGLRELPLAGREQERDRLWAALTATLSAGEPQVAWIRGPAGVGRSRLARWLGELAEETGVASALWTRFEPSGKSVIGLAASLLEPGLGRYLPPDTPPTEGTLARVLLDAAARHPLVVVLDDVHWGESGVALAETLIKLGGAPVLLVLTSSSGGWRENDPGRATLWTLAAEHGLTLDLRPLGPRPIHRLLAEGLDVAYDAADVLAPLVQGTPGLAVQLVEDWTRRGVLEASADGLRLRPGAPTPLPHDVAALWERRFDAVLAPLEDSEGVRLALERAACLGVEVTRGTWRGVCGGSAPLEAAERAVIQARLARSTAAGWRFEQAVVRETLLTVAARHERLAGHHRACVDWLLARGAPTTTAARRRIGRHLLGCGRADEAVDVLLESAQGALLDGRRAGLYGVMAEVDAALERLGNPSDARRARVAYLRARLLGPTVSSEAAAEELQRARLLAEDTGAEDVLLDVRRYEATLLARAGRNREALEMHVETIAGMARQENWQGCFMSHLNRVSWHSNLDETDEALEALAEAEALLVHLGSLERARLGILGTLVYNARGEHAVAEARGREALTHVGDNPYVRYSLLTNTGVSLQHQGRLEEALPFYEAAAALAVEAGMPKEGLPSLNLGDAWLALGEPAKADRALTRAIRALRRSGHLQHLSLALSSQMRACLALGHIERAHSLWPDLVDLVQVVGLASRDMRRELDSLAESCEAAQASELLEGVRALAGSAGE